jgi:2-polyprenyl-3-methyl-5-hydroxy-6-metoxy-1,4-benzoquinol methylase
MDTYKQASNLEHQVKEFYSNLKFPGPYSIEDLKFYDKNLINPYLKFYDVAIQECKTVLDIGCGPGIFLQEAKKLGHDAVGITLSRSDFRLCKQLGFEMYHTSMTDLPIQDNSNMVEDNIEITGVDDPVD